LAARQTLGDSDKLLTISFVGPIPNTFSTKTNSSTPFEFSIPSSSSSTFVPNRIVSLEEHEDFEDKMMKKMMEAAAKQKQQAQQNI